MASLANVEHRNQDATVYVGNLDAACDEDLITELFVQVGRVKSVYMPKDKLTNQHNGYGFVEFLDAISAEYARTILNNIKVYGRPMRVSQSSLPDESPTGRNVGANLFIGNLDPETVTDQLLYDTFVVFGSFARPPHLAKDSTTGDSKGYGFVSYTNFQASDTAIDCMNGQYLGNRIITVQYALKKDSEGRPTSERHGTRAERMLAAAAASSSETSASGKSNSFRPNSNFNMGNIPAPPPIRPPPLASSAGGPMNPPGIPPPPPMHPGINSNIPLPPPPVSNA